MSAILIATHQISSMHLNTTPTGTVVITGTPTQGQVLTLLNTLTDIDGLGAISYKWFANDTEISGATEVTYTLTQAEVGKTITAKASYTDSFGALESVTSLATTNVRASLEIYPTNTFIRNYEGFTTTPVNRVLPVGTSSNLISSLIVDSSSFGIAITNIDSAKCNLWYCIDTAYNWIPITNVSETNALILPPTAILYYVPTQRISNINYNGTNTTIFDYRILSSNIVPETRIDTTTDNQPLVNMLYKCNGIMVDVNDIPTAQITTNAITYQSGTSVTPFTNVNITGGVGDNGNNNIIKQMTIQVTGIKDGANEIINIDNVSIPLVAKTATALPSGGTYAVSGTASIMQIVLLKTTGFSSSTLNTLLSNMTYSNILPTPTAGIRSVKLTNITDLGTFGNAQTVNYLGSNSATLSIISTITI